MFRLKIKLFLLVTILSINLNLKCTDFADVEELYINSFNPQNFDSSEKTKIEDLNNISEQKKYTQIVLDLFKLNDISTTDNLVKTSNNIFKNLEILCGEHKLNSHILAEIDRTHGFAGRLFLAQLLTKPTKDINELANRQNTVKQLLNDNNFEKLNLALTEYQKYEPYFLDFFDKDEFHELFTSSHYAIPALVEISKLLMAGLKTKFSHEVPEILNDYAKEAVTFKTYKHINNTIAINPFFMDMTSQLTNIAIPISSLYYATFKLSATPYIKAFKETDNMLAKGYYGSTAFSLPATFVYTQIKNQKNNFKILKKAYYKLSKISQVIKSFNTIKEIVYSNNILKDQFKTFAPLEKISLELEKLLKMLNSKTFEKENLSKLDLTVLFFIHGKVLSAAYLLAKNKEELVNYLKAIGQFDAYLSIANLYKESQKHNAKYCFAQYLDQNNSYINIQDFWMPFIKS